MKLYEFEVNGYEIYFSEGLWFVSDEYGDTPYETRQDAIEAAKEG